MWPISIPIVNPLPAHYYCPVCKKVEFVLGEKCRIDLPDKECSCGNNYNKDGFGVDPINMYPFCRWNEIYVSNNGTELAKKGMRNFYMIRESH